MSTNNMSDKELDNLFRKSAESFDPPFDPEAWQDMETKLDRVKPRRPWWYKLFFPLLLVMFTSSDIEVIRQAQEPVMLTGYTFTGGITPELLNEKPLLRSHANKEQTIRHEAVTDTEKEDLPASASAAPENIKDNRLGNELSAKPAVFRYSSSSIQNATIAAPAGGTALLLEQPIVTQLNKRIFSPLPEPHPDSVVIVSGTDETLHVKADSSTTSKNDGSERAFLRTLQVAILVAPDITTVRFRDSDAVSLNAGLLVSLPVTNRISIATGAIWANKVYGARPEDYAPTPDYWDSKKKPVSIDATCKVLDIPLNISYRIMSRGRNSLALQAGLSSYIMLKENYTYNYKYGYKSYSSYVEHNNEYRHLFAVQNISVSYTREITPAISVGVEPFVKIPLKGVGAGEVKLSSAGIFLTAGYTFKLKD